MFFIIMCIVAGFGLVLCVTAFFIDEQPLFMFGVAVIVAAIVLMLIMLLPAILVKWVCMIIVTINILIGIAGES